MSTVDTHGLRLGRVPAPPDPRNLRFAAYTPPDLPAPPARVDRLRRVKTYPMYGNDRIGDCEVCGCAHAEQSLSLHGSGTEHMVADADVIAAYSAITGYNPATGEPDPGIRTLDMLNHWRRAGIGGRQITAYVEVNVHDLDEVKQAIYLGGALLVGIDMPLSAADQFQAGQTWKAVRGPRGRAGSWGGHAVHVGAYTTRGLKCTTWGTVQPITWAFWLAYVAEAFVPVSPSWFNASGKTPTGLDYDALLADLRRVTGH